MSVAATPQKPQRPPTTATLHSSATTMTPDVSAPDPLKGAYVDTVARVSDIISSTQELDPLVDLLTMAYLVCSPSPRAEDPLNTLMRTLSADKLGRVTTEKFPRGFTRDEVVQSFCRFLSPVLNGLTGLVDFEQAVDASKDPDAFRRFWTLDTHNLLADATSGTSPSASIVETEVSFVDTFVEGAQGKRVALLKERGLLALVPAEVRPGDEVWTVTNLSFPVLVRPVEETETARRTSKIIGEAYVHGLCESEPPSGHEERYKDVDLPLSSVAVGLAGSIPS